MRITFGLALVAAAFLGPVVAADASAQVTRIDFQVVESPARRPSPRPSPMPLEENACAGRPSRRM